MDKGPVSAACEAARQSKDEWTEFHADEIAWAMCRELKGRATDLERERLAEAIRDFLA